MSRFQQALELICGYERCPLAAPPADEHDFPVFGGSIHELSQALAGGGIRGHGGHVLIVQDPCTRRPPTSIRATLRAWTLRIVEN